MNKTLKYMLLSTVFGVSLSVGVAQATEGMFPNGSGARQKALAGAGAADGQDATSSSINPAALARLDSQTQFSVSLFNPIRSTTAAGTEYKSDSDFFAIPNLAVNYRVNSDMVDAIGFSVVGAGGMNTDYQASILADPRTGKTTGINLEQMLIAISLAKKFGNVSVGISPTLARQTFEGRGIQNPNTGAFVADGQQDVSWGYGLRAGAEIAVSPQFRIGVAGATKMYMQNFDEFNQLFPNNGELDLPANLQVGLAYDISPALTLMADYRYIANSDVDAIGLSPASGGFGWKDVQTFKIGLEYEYNPEWTLRAGYAYNTQPIRSDYVQINQVAPGVIQHHLTAGFKKANFLMPGLDLEVAGMYAPNETVSGIGQGRDQNGNPITFPIDLQMEQFELTAGLSWKF